MRILESALEAKIHRYCDASGILYKKLRLASESGWPDRTLLYKGRVMFLELKKLGEKPNALQQFVLDDLTSLGFLATWTDRYEIAIEIIRNWKHHVDIKSIHEIRP